MTPLQRAWGAWIGTMVLLAAYFHYIGPLEQMAGGLPHLDVRYGVGYTLADVMAYFERLGPEGRAFYARTTAFDTVWPFAVAATGALWAEQSFERRWAVVGPAFCPVVFGLLDLVENIGIWMMLWQFPSTDPAVSTVFNVVTLVKQAMIPGWSLVLLGLPSRALEGWTPSTHWNRTDVAPTPSTSRTAPAAPRP